MNDNADDGVEPGLGQTCGGVVQHQGHGSHGIHPTVGRAAIAAVAPAGVRGAQPPLAFPRELPRSPRPLGAQRAWRAEASQCLATLEERSARRCGRQRRSTGRKELLLRVRFGRRGGTSALRPKLICAVGRRRSLLCILASVRASTAAVCEGRPRRRQLRSSRPRRSACADGDIRKRVHVVLALRLAKLPHELDGTRCVLPACLQAQMSWTTHSSMISPERVQLEPIPLLTRVTNVMSNPARLWPATLILCRTYPDLVENTLAGVGFALSPEKQRYSGCVA